MKFTETSHETKRDIVSLTSACEEIRKSEKFAQVIKLVLSIGNYMNAGSRNARAIGFEISFLPKLMSTKTVDNKSTLLHFIVKMMEQKYPESLKFYEEDLLHLDKAARGWLRYKFEISLIEINDLNLFTISPLQPQQRVSRKVCLTLKRAFERWN